MDNVMKVKDFNQHFQCPLCSGYLINATSLIDCFHLFCRSCIVKHLQSNNQCPVCKIKIPPNKLWTSLVPDSRYQSLIYKVIPGLYRSEVKMRNDYLSSVESSGYSINNKLSDIEPKFYSLSDKINILLMYHNGINLNEISEPSSVKTVNQKQPSTTATATTSSTSSSSPNDKRYLLCPAGFSISSLKKFICLKYELTSSYGIEILYEDEILDDTLLLLDILYIYSNKQPLPLFYKFKQNVTAVLQASNGPNIKKGSPSAPSSSSSSTPTVTKTSNTPSSASTSTSASSSTTTNSATKTHPHQSNSIKLATPKSTNSFKSVVTIDASIGTSTTPIAPKPSSAATSVASSGLLTQSSSPSTSTSTTATVTITSGKHQLNHNPSDDQQPPNKLKKTVVNQNGLMKNTNYIGQSPVTGMKNIIQIPRHNNNLTQQQLTQSQLHQQLDNQKQHLQQQIQQLNHQQSKQVRFTTTCTPVNIKTNVTNLRNIRVSEDKKRASTNIQSSSSSTAATTTTTKTHPHMNSIKITASGNGGKNSYKCSNFNVSTATTATTPILPKPTTMTPGSSTSQSTSISSSTNQQTVKSSTTTLNVPTRSSPTVVITTKTNNSSSAGNLKSIQNGSNGVNANETKIESNDDNGKEKGNSSPSNEQNVPKSPPIISSSTITAVPSSTSSPNVTSTSSQQQLQKSNPQLDYSRLSPTSSSVSSSIVTTTSASTNKTISRQPANETKSSQDHQVKESIGIEKVDKRKRESPVIVDSGIGGGSNNSSGSGDEKLVIDSEDNVSDAKPSKMIKLCNGHSGVANNVNHKQSKQQHNDHHHHHHQQQQHQQQQQQQQQQKNQLKSHSHLHHPLYLSSPPHSHHGQISAHTHNNNQSKHLQYQQQQQSQKSPNNQHKNELNVNSHTKNSSSSQMHSPNNSSGSSCGNRSPCSNKTSPNQGGSAFNVSSLISHSSSNYQSNTNNHTSYNLINRKQDSPPRSGSTSTSTIGANNNAQSKAKSKPMDLRDPRRATQIQTMISPPSQQQQQQHQLMIQPQFQLSPQAQFAGQYQLPNAALEILAANMALQDPTLVHHPAFISSIIQQIANRLPMVASQVSSSPSSATQASVIRGPCDNPFTSLMSKGFYRDTFNVSQEENNHHSPTGNTNNSGNNSTNTNSTTTPSSSSNNSNTTTITTSKGSNNSTSPLNIITDKLSSKTKSLPTPPPQPTTPSRESSTNSSSVVDLSSK